MEALNEVNELLTAKLCSPVIVFGVVAIISLVSMFMCHRILGRYNTQKMQNLKNLCMNQEVKYLVVLGVTMFGLCQYNKADLAWIFLIFPIIYIIIQNSLLYIHLSSAIQNAPEPPSFAQASTYGLGMNAPLLEQGGAAPPKAEITKPQESRVPSVTSGGFEYAKPSNQLGSSMGSASWDSAF
jgi:hypothetical protein